MAILEMGPPVGSFLLTEANKWRSRDEVEVSIPVTGVKSGTLLKAGVAPEDPLVPVAAVADTPVAVALNDHFRDDPDVAQVKKIAVMARDCELRGNALVMPDGATDAQKVTLASKLAPAGIVVRW